MTTQRGTYRDLASAVLVAHQRYNASSCLCGWSELGQSWAEHVASVLDAAGALRDRPPVGECSDVDVLAVANWVGAPGSDGDVPTEVRDAAARLRRRGKGSP